MLADVSLKLVSTQDDTRVELLNITGSEQVSLPDDKQKLTHALLRIHSLDIITPVAENEINTLSLTRQAHRLHVSVSLRCGRLVNRRDILEARNKLFADAGQVVSSDDARHNSLSLERL
jgi:hypothetical protein